MTHTEILLDHGRATVEVDQLYKLNRILIDQQGGQTQLLQNGLYEFDAAASTVRVFKGKAAVYPGNDYNTGVKPIDIKSERQLTLTSGPMKPQKFDKDKIQAGDNLYAWSDLRSGYLGQANVDLAYQYSGAPGFAPGWFWNPYLYSYTWLPGDGLFWSPFGYGFYSPWYIYGGGIVYGGRGWYGGHPIHPGGYYGYRGGAEGYRGSAVSAPHASAGFSGGGGFHGGGGGGGGHR